MILLYWLSLFSAFVFALRFLVSQMILIIPYQIYISNDFDNPYIYVVFFFFSSWMNYRWEVSLVGLFCCLSGCVSGNLGCVTWDLTVLGWMRQWSECSGPGSCPDAWCSQQLEAADLVVGPDLQRVCPVLLWLWCVYLQWAEDHAASPVL